MEVLHQLRRSQARIARVAVGLFAFTWLGLALQPCMAALPVVPPSVPTEAPAAHPCHGETAQAPATDPAAPACPHCPQGHPGQGECAQGGGLGCGAASAPVLEQRDLMLGKLLLLVPAAWVVLDLGLQALDCPDPPRQVPDPPPRVPLQERFCTHLE